MVLVVGQIDFQLQFGAYFQCGQFLESDWIEVVPHERVFIRNKWFRAQNQKIRLRLSRFQMCFQPAVIVRMQADYR